MFPNQDLDGNSQVPNTNAINNVLNPARTPVQSPLSKGRRERIQFLVPVLGKEGARGWSLW